VVGSDGGVFTFGDARFRGSVPGLGIRTQHVVAMVASPTGAGYMLVGWDGGVFTFGDVKFYGSIPGLGIHIRSIRDAVLSSSATGYALVGADGGAFKFGTGVRFHGSLPGMGVRVNNIVGIALTPDDGGYLMAGSDGKVYSFGNAKVQPEPADLRPNLPVVAIASVPAPRPTVGLAERAFQSIQQLLPQDRFEKISAASYASDYDVYNNNPLNSTVTFRCLTCGPASGTPYAFTIQWFRSHGDAVGSAVTYVKVAQSAAIGYAYAPQYVAGSALMAPSAPTPWPPPDRVVRAFGQAVGQPVVTIQLPYGALMPGFVRTQLERDLELV
jgi:hypothetical protein